MFKTMGKIAAAVLMLLGALSFAGAIKTWSSGDPISIADINANFQHIHNNMVGGHGARLVDADVSASAAISYTKVQNGRGIARAMGASNGTCTTGTCTMVDTLNVTSVTWNSAGNYTVTLNYTATDNAMIAACSTGSKASTVAAITLCQIVATGTTTLNVLTWDPRTNTATNSPFTFVVFDNN